MRTILTIGRKEATMHTQTATPYLTETGYVFLVSCDQCGPLGVVEDDATTFMLDHAKVGV